MEWKEVNNQLHKKFEFKNFKSAMIWMLEVSYSCEAEDHHPNWRNEYNKVEVCLSTHDAGNVVTEKDRKLAKIMDQAFHRQNK